jgi:hypothetical protein
MNVLKASTVRTAAIAVLVQLPASAIAQHAFEKNDHVIYEDATKHQTDLGRGFNPILTADGKVAMIRGPRFEGQNADFDCNNRGKKNWIVQYDPATRMERTLFDRVIPFGDGKFPFCIYEQMQLSPDGRTLYLVSPVYATSGSMAIVHLPQQTISYVPGVNFVYVIETGPHRGELIYNMRTFKRDVRDTRGSLTSPRYPIIHAKSDGQEIEFISDEYISVGGNPKKDFPKLAAYLRQIGGRITIEGQTLP